VSRIQVTVLSDASARPLVLALVPAFAEASGIDPDGAQRLETVVGALVDFTLDHAYPGDDLGKIEVTLEADADLVRVTVHDWGLPLTSAGGDVGPLPEPLDRLADAQDVKLLNLGSGGKRLAAEVPVRSSGDPEARRHHVGADERQRRDEVPDTIEVRAATLEDAEGIAQLLYESYHLSYVHADFYRPRYLMILLESGQLLSAVAVHEGSVVGHHALLPVAGVPSAETGAAVVHTAYRGLGLFGQLFDHTLGVATEHGLASVFGDAVTIHPFSQRVESSHGYRETALQLGMIPAQTTMRGFGGEGPRRRTATLRSYRPLDGRPREVFLPAAYGELLESVYENLELRVTARSDPAEIEGDAVTATCDEPRALGLLRIRRWDDETAAELTHEVRHLLSQHVDVVYVDLDLASLAEVDEATAAANELGFFAAGLVLHGPDGHDHLRLQRLDAVEIELDGVVCDSSFAQTLKRRVLEDRARVGG
jgi:anti-sigma regulatory factor (Ser/Thr protein kinase)/N-acetylglutamate synthase-like GNAT family acetyltransferase